MKRDDALPSELSTEETQHRLAAARAFSHNSSMELTFFDIPVYRLTQKIYEAEQEAYIQKEIAELKKSPYVEQNYCEDQKEEQRMHDHLWQQYGGAWQFNEIIGFIRLHFLGTQIRGEWWRVDAKRITRSRKKVFHLRDWKITYEEEIPPGSTNAQIYALILKYLLRAQAEKHIKRFHIDTSLFERIGPHVDWNALLKKANERPPAS